MLTKAKKSLLVSLSALLCAMLLAFGLSTTSIFAHKTANAADESTTVENAVAKIGDVTYETLQDALDNGNNKTVKLIANVNANVTINQYKTTLDLNGFTLNGGTAAGKPTLTITNNAFIIDSSADKTGTVKREDTAENSGKGSHYVIDIQDGTTIIEDGNFVNNSGSEGATSGASLIRIGDDSYSKYPQLTIKGGTFTQDNFVVIKVDRGTLFVTGGTLNSQNSYAVESWGPRTTIKGGVINGKVAAWTYADGNNTKLEISDGTINGDVKAVNYGNTTEKKAEISITGGYIGGTLGTYVYNGGSYTEAKDSTVTISVTGGTFDKDPSKYLTESAKATSDGGKFTVEKAYLAKVGDNQYYTMDEAFKAQTESGAEIVLLRDYTTSSVFNSGSINRTIDLNGHTWTYNGTDSSSAAFEINYSNASLKVKNGKIVSATMIGLIPSAMSGTITYNNSSLVFESVEMTANGHSGFETNGLNENDDITLTGCKLIVSNGYGIYFPSSGTLTIENTIIEAKTMGVQVCAGSLYISGTTRITVTGEAVSKTESDGAIEDGAAVSVVDRAGYKGLKKAEIVDGTFISANGEAVKAYKWGNNTETEFDNREKLIAISGGTFSNLVSAKYCADYFRPSKNNNDTYAVRKQAFTAVRLSLGNEVVLKYYVNPEFAEQIQKAVVSYEVGEKTVTKELTRVTSGGDYYIINWVTPQMIDRKFSVTAFFDGYVVYDDIDYSVLSYLGSVMSSHGNETKYKDIIANFLNYCQAAADYVGYTDTVSAIETFYDSMNYMYKLKSAIYTYEIDKKDYGVATNVLENAEKIANVSVRFDSRLKILVGVAKDKIESGEYTVRVTVDEATVDVTEWNDSLYEGYYVYTTAGVYATAITDTSKCVKVEVLEKGKVIQTSIYNVAGYCMARYASSTNAKFKALAKATCYYGDAAKAFEKTDGQN